MRTIVLAGLCGAIGVAFALVMRFLLPEKTFIYNTDWIPQSVDRFAGLLVYCSICGAVLGALASIPSGVGRDPLPFVRCLLTILIASMLFAVLWPVERKSAVDHGSVFIPPPRVVAFFLITTLVITGYSLWRGRLVTRSRLPT